MKYYVTSIIFLVSLISLSQNFSGKIISEKIIVPKISSHETDSIVNINKNKTSEYLIMNGYYKSTYLENNIPTYTYTYHQESQRMYDDHKERPYISFRDARKTNVVYKDPEVYNDSLSVILGYETYLVKSEYSTGNYDGYYSKDLRINPEAFAGHAVGNWYNKMKITGGGMSLKTITEYENYTEISQAINIIPMKLTAEDFKLNPNKPIVASPEALDDKVSMLPLSDDQIQTYLALIEKGNQLIQSREEYTSHILFVVDKDGNPNYVEPLFNMDPVLDELAIQIFSSCKFRFEPGKIEGQAISSVAYLPIKFEK